ncbi:DNA mismatch repair protein [Acarospora aff. strigata]|nr:DNA mismatch repair protein [Acarospora aff. strigata]
MEIDTGAHRGTKRKADESNLSSQTPKRIKPLDEDVVNKIAAGEIIVAPVHALKELIENSVDAGSTSIEIVVKDGGLKLLQITDNGHGINRDDLAILCERFTTSKLKEFEDLTSIGTYGFRGEALASISHIAHLTVTTKTVDSSCAWRAHYSSGKLAPAKPGQSAEPKATAGRGGTQITVEDLFYNVPTRRRAFRSASEEYAKILDVVGRYAVHRTGVAFSCKKHGESNMGISTPSNATTVDRIRQIHGSAVANELIEFGVSDDKWGFKASGWTSNANYSVKRTMLLLFINHRAVESSAIKKAIEQTYSTFLPKGGHPFTYLTLDIDPQRVDVNVHPTKREVNFLNEDEIIESICNEIRVKLAKVDTSRTFMTQSLLPGARVSLASGTSTRENGTSTAIDNDRRTSRRPLTAQKPYENNLVRTDSKMRKITSMLQPDQPPPTSDNTATDPHPEDMDYQYSDREPIHCRLTSVKELRAEVRSAMHNELTEVFASHTFVGIVDERRRIAAIQAGVKLFLVDYGMVSNEYFYQLGLTDFGNFGSIRFEPPLSINHLLDVAVAHEQNTTNASDTSASAASAPPFDWTEVTPLVTRQLLERRDMLKEYFSLDIDADGMLHGIPLLVKGYMPSLAKLPRFLMRLGPYIDWTNEKACFKTFLTELASFYVPEQLPPPAPSPSTHLPKPTSRVDLNNDLAPPSTNTNTDESPAILPTASETHNQNQTQPAGENEARRIQLHRTLENILFPAFRARLVATKGLLKGVVEVANLKGLYRVFERC